MNLMTPEISKQIGWSGSALNDFPTVEQVENACDLTLCRWQRFLRSPESDSEIDIINLIHSKVYPKNNPQIFKGETDVCG